MSARDWADDAAKTIVDKYVCRTPESLRSDIAAALRAAHERGVDDGFVETCAMIQAFTDKERAT